MKAKSPTKMPQYCQVINAARILTLRSSSSAARDNMAVFRASWDQALALLTQAVDSVVTIDDFLAVSESHVLDDVSFYADFKKYFDVKKIF